MGFQSGEGFRSRPLRSGAVAGRQVRPELCDLGGDQLLRPHGAALQRPVIHRSSPVAVMRPSRCRHRPGRLTQFQHEPRRLRLSFETQF